MLAAGLSGCGTAPDAATVNGQAISEPQLSDELQTLASDRGYVREQDGVFTELYDQAQQNGQQAPLLSVAPMAGEGSGAGSYSVVWTDLVLSSMIAAEAVGQHLRRLGEAPSQGQVAAAWASQWADDPAEWSALPSSERNSEALYDAERGLIDGPPSSMGTASNFYKSRSAYFWSQVCLTAVDVPSGSAGASGMAAAKRQAETIASGLSGHAVPNATPVLGASLYCEAPDQFVQQPTAFQDQVGSLAPGQATVLSESYGYQVVEVRSRAAVPLDRSTAADIVTVASYGGAQAPPQGEKNVEAVLAAAQVQVDPRFGTWATNLPSSCPPQVASIYVGTSGCVP